MYIRLQRKFKNTLIEWGFVYETLIVLWSYHVSYISILIVLICPILDTPMVYPGTTPIIRWLLIGG